MVHCGAAAKFSRHLDPAANEAWIIFGVVQAERCKHVSAVIHRKWHAPMNESGECY